MATSNTTAIASATAAKKALDGGPLKKGKGGGKTTYATWIKLLAGAVSRSTKGATVKLPTGYPQTDWHFATITPDKLKAAVTQSKCVRFHVDFDVGFKEARGVPVSRSGAYKLADYNVAGYIRYGVPFSTKVVQGVPGVSFQGRRAPSGTSVTFTGTNPTISATQALTMFQQAVTAGKAKNPTMYATCGFMPGTPTNSSFAVEFAAELLTDISKLPANKRDAFVQKRIAAWQKGLT